VLPFDNLSPDSADAYLADGLTEELTARLGQIHRLQVMSRNALRRFHRASSDPVTVGRSLGIAYIVSGSVRRSADRLRVTVELMLATTGVRVWGELYDRGTTDLLVIEEDIARRVAGAVAGRLLPRERAALAAAPTNSRIAYDHYLRGLVHFSRRAEDPRAVIRSLQEFEAAVVIDTSFAQAYARIGIAYCQLAIPNAVVARNVTRDTALARASAAADRALLLDSAIADAWLARGRVLTERDSQPGRSVDAYRRGVALDPNNAEALNFQGLAVLFHFAAIDESRAALARAVALDPNHPTYLNNLAVATFAARRFDEARRWWDSALAVAPNAGPFYAGRAMARLALGDTSGALQDARTSERLVPEWPWPKAVIALGNVDHGDSAQALVIAERLGAADSAPDAVRGLSVAAIFTALGDHEHALDYLERVRPRQGYTLPLVLTYVFLDPLRSNTRFQRLVAESQPR
jgi:serine/threonine-protein kinase